MENQEKKSCENCKHIRRSGKVLDDYCGMNAQTIIDPEELAGQCEDFNPDLETKGKKFDSGKLRLDLLPFDALEEVAKVLMHGAEKYGAHNWREVDNAKERYTSALLRHLSAIMQGEEVDPESGFRHIAHVACNALFLVAFDRKESE